MSRNNRKKYFIAKGRADTISTTPIINKDTKNEFLSFVIIFSQFYSTNIRKKIDKSKFFNKKKPSGVETLGGYGIALE